MWHQLCQCSCYCGGCLCVLTAYYLVDDERSRTIPTASQASKRRTPRFYEVTALTGQQCQRASVSGDAYTGGCSCKKVASHSTPWLLCVVLDAHFCLPSHSCIARETHSPGWTEGFSLAMFLTGTSSRQARPSFRLCTGQSGSLTFTKMW